MGDNTMLLLNFTKHPQKSSTENSVADHHMRRAAKGLFIASVKRSPSAVRYTTSKIMETRKDLPSSEKEWKLVLSPMQYNVLREKATEPPGFSESTEGELEYQLKKEYGNKFPKTGVYHCVACNAPLYTAQTKFDSECGWPAFFEGVKGAIKEVPDEDGRRVEIQCNNCSSHLGHVFRGEGFPIPTDERHCVNGVCLTYVPAE